MTSIRTLIIGDLHAPKSLAPIDALVERVAPDRVILLGDYLDHFNDTPADAERIGCWLHTRMGDSRFTFLLGNHDMSYFFPGHIHCPGYEVEKAVAFRKVLDTDAFLRIAKLAHWLEDTTLLTHAGLSRSLVSSEIGADGLREWLDKEIAAAWEDLQKADERPRHWIWRAGRGRLGDQPVGGILWCDFEDEFEPIPGLSQICGHTPRRVVRLRKESDGTINICADACDAYGGGPAEVLLYENGNYETLKVLPTQK